jgi:hypothetical protein
MGATYSTDSGIPGHNATVTVRARVLKDKIRFTMPGTAAAAFGNYTIVDSAAGTVAKVFPKGNLVLLWSSKSGISETAPIIKVEVHVGPGYAMEDLGGGEPILGHATHRYRETLPYETHVTVGGDSCTRHLRTVSELWVTPDSGVPDIEAPIRINANGIGSIASSNAFKTIAEARGSRIRGVVLRRTTTSTNPLAVNNSLAIHSSWEITELKRHAIDASEFEAPSGYKVNDMRKMAPGVDSSVRRAIALDSGRSIRKRLCGNGGV